MPAPNWQEINRRILVIGKFSDELAYATGRQLTGSFIEEIKPVYYREYNAKAFEFTNREFYGGFDLLQPDEKTANDGATLVPIGSDSPLLKAVADGDAANPIPWAVKVGEANYKKLYGMLEQCQSIIAKENFIEGLTEDAVRYVINNIRSVRNAPITPADVMAIATENVKTVAAFLRSPEKEIETVNYSDTEAAKAFKKCLCNFKNMPGNQDYSNYFTIRRNLVDFFSDPTNVPSIILWLFSLKGKDYNTPLNEKTDLDIIADRMFESETPDFDFEQAAGVSLETLIEFGKVGKTDAQEVICAPIVTGIKEFFRQECGADASYKKDTFIDKAVKNLTDSLLMISDEVQAIIDSIKEDIKKLKAPRFRTLIKGYWQAEQPVPIPPDKKEILAEIFVGTKADDWAAFPNDIPSQVRFVFEMLKTIIIKPKVEEPIERNEQTIQRNTVKSGVIYEGLMTAEPSAAPLRVAHVPNERFRYSPQLLQSHLALQLPAVKTTVLEVGKKEIGLLVSDIETFCRARDLSNVTIAIGDDVPTVLLSPPEQPLANNAQPNGNDGIVVEINTMLTTASQNGKCDLVLRTADGKIEILPDECQTRITKIQACYELIKNDDALATEVKSWHASYVKVGAFQDEQQARKYSIPIILQEIIAQLPDDITAFGKPHTGQEYGILLDIVKFHRSPAAPQQGGINDIRFGGKFFPIKDAGDMGKVTTYYQERCTQSLALLQYAKRISDLEQLSQSGAEVWVINDTIEKYYANGGVRFWETGGNVPPVHCVYVTENAGVCTAIDTHLKDVGNLTQIAYKPVWFFEDKSQRFQPQNDQLVPTFPFVNRTNIPRDKNKSNEHPDECKFQSGPTIDPVLLLAVATLDFVRKSDSKNRPYLLGGDCYYRRGYDVCSYESGQPVQAFQLVANRVFDHAITKHFSDVFKQLWAFDDTLAKIFLRTRLDNIALAGWNDSEKTNPLHYFGLQQQQWEQQKAAFRSVPLLHQLISGNLQGESPVSFGADEKNKWAVGSQSVLQHPIPIAPTQATMPTISWKIAGVSV